MENPDVNIINTIMEIQRVCSCLSNKTDKIVAEMTENLKAINPSLKDVLSEVKSEC